jgi:hypothetical protein
MELRSRKLQPDEPLFRQAFGARGELFGRCFSDRWMQVVLFIRFAATPAGGWGPNLSPLGAETWGGGE